jgi:hypothetical protein
MFVRFVKMTSRHRLLRCELCGHTASYRGWRAWVDDEETSPQVYCFRCAIGFLSSAMGIELEIMQ